jgi:hypothetical protein
LSTLRRSWNPPIPAARGLVPPSYAYLMLKTLGRVAYRTRRGPGWFFVIADCYEDGTWDFGESEGDEPRWHHFEPSPDELEFARRSLCEFPALQPVYLP